ncbi:MAG: ROK family protein [Streptosporangiaceae bacterium]
MRDPDRSLLRPSDRQLVATLRRHGQLPRDRLARLSGLPRSTVTDSLTRLRSQGIVTEQAMPRPTGKAGRPAKLLALAAPAGLVGVIALTHQTLQAAVAGMDGTLHARRGIDPYGGGSGPGLAADAIALLDQALSDIQRSRADLIRAVAGLPMPINGPSGMIQLALSDQLGLPVRIENDANLGALAEGAFGAAAGMENFIYIKIAHGLGAGLVLERHLYRGTNGLAGELAHIHVEGDGALCPCGGRGCLMTSFNTPRLIDWIQTVHPGAVTMADVLALAADQDTGVCRILRDLGRTLGRSLADLCVYLAPDGIILDGVLENAAVPVIDGIRQMLSQLAPPAVAAQVKIVGGLLGHDAELRGGAVLARQHHLAGG